MEHIRLDPQKQVWPFVHKVKVKSEYGVHWELDRHPKAYMWVIVTDRYGRLFVNEFIWIKDKAVDRARFFYLRALHTKGGVVLRDPQDMIDFMNI